MNIKSELINIAQIKYFVHTKQFKNILFTLKQHNQISFSFKIMSIPSYCDRLIHICV